MIWTDPPYGVDYVAKNAYLNRSDRDNRIQVPIENDKLDRWRNWLSVQGVVECRQKLGADGSDCVRDRPHAPLLVNFIQAFAAAGFTFRAQLTSVKQQFVIGMADYHHHYEPILYGWLPDGAHYFIEDRRLAWRVAQGLLLPFSPPPSTKAGQLQSTPWAAALSALLLRNYSQLRSRRNVLQ
jgi:DNA modification methylase